MKTTDGFRGKYAFLSNFHYCPIEFEGKVYNCSENVFQAMKTPFKSERVQFENCKPIVGKRNGKKVTLRYDWEEVKVEMMAKALRLKFSQNESLRKALLETGDIELVEYNHWGDDYWGVCSPEGLNILGLLLMREREHWKKLGGY